MLRWLRRYEGGEFGYFKLKYAKELFLEAKRTGADTMLTNCPVCYLNLATRTHAAPNSVVEEWRKYEDPLKVNDTTQYLAALL